VGVFGVTRMCMYVAVQPPFVQGVQQLLLAATNQVFGIRLGLSNQAADTVVVLSRPVAPRGLEAGWSAGENISCRLLQCCHVPLSVLWCCLVLRHFVI